MGISEETKGYKASEIARELIGLHQILGEVGIAPIVPMLITWIIR